MAKRRTKTSKPAKPLLAAAEARVVGVPPPLPPRRRGLTREQRFERLVARSGGPDDCNIWMGSVGQTRGYGQFSDVSPQTGKKSMRSAHVVAWELANGRSRPEGGSILHSSRCRSKLCVNPDHLRLGTPRENSQDAKRDGRLKGSRLNASQAQQIVSLHRLGLSRTLLAERFGVSPQSIASILNGRTWGGVTGIPRAPLKGGRPRKVQEPIAPKLTRAERRQRVLEALP